MLLSAQVITAGGGIDITFISCTNGGVKPTPNRIAKFTGAPSKCVTATTTDTTGFLGITVPDAQTAPNSSIQRFGLAFCDFDGSTVAGDSTKCKRESTPLCTALIQFASWHRGLST
jgi:hypothetical protein